MTSSVRRSRVTRAGPGMMPAPACLAAEAAAAAERVAVLLASALWHEFDAGRQVTTGPDDGRIRNARLYVAGTPQYTSSVNLVRRPLGVLPHHDAISRKRGLQIEARTMIRLRRRFQAPPD